MHEGNQTESRIIAVSASFVLPSFPVGTSPSDPALLLIPGPVFSKLKNVGAARIKNMRSAGVAVQVISHVPIATTSHACIKINDALHAAVRANPDAFAALALLPADDPKGAARELMRCVKEHHFVGGILGLADGIDDETYDQLWAVAEKYEVPIALKEVWPTLDESRMYEGNSSRTLLGPLLTAFHTTHTATPLPILHLYIAGIFDRFPLLQLILSQTGVTISSLLPRIETMLDAVSPSPKIPEVLFLDVWRRNFFISTEDILDLASLRALLEHAPAERVLFGVPYPFEERSRKQIAAWRDSGVLSIDEWERITRLNAEALFGLGEHASAATQKMLDHADEDGVSSSEAMDISSSPSRSSSS